MTVRFSAQSKPTFSPQFVKLIEHDSANNKDVQKLLEMSHDFQNKYWDGSTSLLESQFRIAFKAIHILDLVEFITALSLFRKKNANGQAETAFEALLISLEKEVLFPLADSKEDADQERIGSIVSCLKALPQFLDENSWVCEIAKMLDREIAKRKVVQVVMPNFLEREPELTSLMEDLTLLPPPLVSTANSLESAAIISSLSLPVIDPVQHFLLNRGDCFKVELEELEQWEVQLKHLGFRQPLDFRLNRKEWEEGVEFRHPQQIVFNCVPSLSALSKLSFICLPLERRANRLLEASEGLPLAPLYKCQRFYLSREDSTCRQIVEQVFSHSDSQGICFFAGEGLREAKFLLSGLMDHLKGLGIKTLFLPFFPVILQDHLDFPEKRALLKSYEELFLKDVYGDLSSLFKKAEEGGIRIVGLEIRETILFDHVSSLDRDLLKRICLLQDVLAQHIISKIEGKFIVFSDGVVLSSLYSSSYGTSQFPTFQGVPFTPIALL